METAPSERDNDSDLQRVDRLCSTAPGECWQSGQDDEIASRETQQGGVDGNSRSA